MTKTTDWLKKELTCPSCRGTVYFRYKARYGQYYNGLRWEEIEKTAEIVLCPYCGASVYILPVKNLIW
jgi:uncharacterized Zn-finger protein